MSITVNPSVFPRTSINRAVCAPACNFCSLYESKQALTVEQPQRFIDWFAGECINPSWQLTNTQGSGSFGLNNEIGGGMFITTGANVSDRSHLEWCDIRHFDGCGTGAVAIFIFQYCDVTISRGAAGFFNAQGDIGSSTNRSAHFNANTAIANFRIITGNGTSVAGTASCVPTDTACHAVKLEINACTTEITICGGCVDATTSTFQVGAKVSPFIAALNGSAAAAKTTKLKYYEAYSK